MEAFVSRDGTRIACERQGHGPPIVLVHGTAADRQRWSSSAAALAKRFTVYAYDRRGRGESDDGPTYDLEREAEDLLAVVFGIGEPANVVAHSYGAVCALASATLGTHMKKLVLYEPPLAEHVPQVDPNLLERMWGELHEGNKDAVVAMFLTEVVRIAPPQLEAMRQRPEWARRVASAHTLPRELAAQSAYLLDRARLADLRAPVLLLVGGSSPQPFHAVAETLRAAFANARIRVLPGQAHTAMDTAPDLFVSAIIDFIGATSESEERRATA